MSLHLKLFMRKIIFQNRFDTEINIQDLELSMGGAVWKGDPMFKIEVFNALQTRFGPSKYTSLKTTFQNATPNRK